MQRLVLFLLMGFIYTSVSAQPDSTVPGYKKTTKIPDFSIIQSDSTWFTSKQIPQNKSVVIIYFSPDCGHCQITAQALVKDIDKLKNTELIWVSYHTPEQIKEFAENYKLNMYSNVILGRDPNYFIPVFYHVQYTPFMAVYNKKGKFIKAFERGTDPETLVKTIKEGK